MANVRTSRIEWYLADLVLRFTIEEELGITVHINTTLINAHSADEAYTKAMLLGQLSAGEFINTEQRSVRVDFLGLRELLAVVEDLVDGAELYYEELESFDDREVNRIAKPRERLAVFAVKRDS